VRASEAGRVDSELVKNLEADKVCRRNIVKRVNATMKFNFIYFNYPVTLQTVSSGEGRVWNERRVGYGRECREEQGKTGGDGRWGRKGGLL
jgi:hypothetical protein